MAQADRGALLRCLLLRRTLQGACLGPFLDREGREPGSHPAPASAQLHPGVESAWGGIGGPFQGKIGNSSPKDIRRNWHSRGVSGFPGVSACIAFSCLDMSNIGPRLTELC